MGLTDFFAGVLLGFVLGFIFAGVWVIDAERDRAVEAGVAFYAVDPKTGEVKFEYRTAPVVP